MRKINLIFALLLSLMGVTQVKAETLTANFNSGLPEGWSLVGDISNSDDRARSGKGLWTSSKSTTANYVITEAVEGSFEFYARAYNKSYASTVVVYEYTGSGLGDQLYTTGSMYTSSTPTWSKYSFTISSGTQLAIVLNYAAIDDVTYTQMEVAEGPALIVKDGSKVTSPYSYDFGLATAGTTKTFTLSNPGTASVGISVSETGSFGATLSATTIAAGGEATLTVSMPETSGSSAVTITPDASGIDPFVINVSGTVKDPNKFFEDFSGNALPDNWEAASSSTYYSWSYSNGYASYSGSSSSYTGTLTTPLLAFASGEKLFFSTSRYGSSTWYSPSISVQTSTDGSTWTTLQTFTDDEYGVWKTRSVEIPSSDVKYIRFSGWYINIDNIYGGELPMVANMKVTAEDHNFGMISETAQTTFTIKNSGRAELTGIQIVSDNAAFTISDAPTSLGADEEATVTVSMGVDTKGAQSGVITVSAPDQETVTFNVSGYVADDSKLMITFDDNKVPENWENTGWSFSGGVATGSYTSSTSSRNSEMITPSVEVGEGETMAIEAKGNGSYAELYVYTSTDDGATWNKVGDFNTLLRANTSAYTVAVLSGVPAGTYKLKFEGYSVSVNTINGFQYDQNAPALTVDPATAAEFGSVKAQPEAKTYTITNSGTGTLEGTIASDNEAFTVSASEFTLAAGESMTFDIALVFDENYGEKSANITITPSNEGLEAVTIAATATTKDPNVWEEDFEDGAIPSNWTNNGWACSNNSYGNNGTYMAFAGNSNDNTLITPRLKAEEGQQLTFEIGGADSTDPITVQYSSDGENWIDMEGSPFTSTGATIFTAPSAGSYYLKFSGKYSSVDNFSGFQLDQLAADFMITASNLPTTGKQYATYEASVTVKNTGTEAQTAVAKLYFGTEEVDVQEAELAVGGEAVITLTYLPNEPNTFDNVSIEVTLKDVAEVEAKTVSAQNVEIVAIPQLSEDGWTYEEGTDYSTSGLQYSAQAGWNTIAVPFALTADHLKKIFGENYKVYYCSGYSDGELSFRTTTNYRAGVPFIVYAESIERDVDNLVVLEDISITATEPSTDDAPFYGTYSPIAAPGMQGKYGVVPSTGKIMKGGSGASLKGFRGYFELPADAQSVKINFYDENDNLVDAIDAIELNNAINGNLYDLSGRKVEGKAKAGVYIKNGKKVVLK